MLSRELRAERILADRRVDAVYFIRDQGAAIADAINKNTSLVLAFSNRERRRIDEIRQIAGILVVGSEVFYFMSVLLQVPRISFFMLTPA